MYWSEESFKEKFIQLTCALADKIQSFQKKIIVHEIGGKLSTKNMLSISDNTHVNHILYVLKPLLHQNQI